MKQTIRTLVMLAPLTLAAAANADYQLDINGGANNYVNTDINTDYTGGFNYPGGGSAFAIGGVGFTSANFGTSADMGIAAANGTTAVLDYSGLSIGVSGSDSLYTLINTGNGGTAGTFEGTLEVFGTGGAYAFLNLVEGVNIRDHFNGAFCNDITDPTVASGYFNLGVVSSDPNSSFDRLDRQELLLGSSFDGQSITEMKFTFDGHDFPDGSAFLAAATVAPSSTPEPTTLAMAVAGLGMVIRRRKLSK